jgi:endogenous inhibitor of DNA gyrase (YacG/DUF329 family)
MNKCNNEDILIGIAYGIQTYTDDNGSEITQYYTTLSNDEYKVIENLIRRDIPMTIVESDDFIGTCPACGWGLEWANNIRRSYNFCPECGQRLTWEKNGNHTAKA